MPDECQSITFHYVIHLKSFTGTTSKPSKCHAHKRGKSVSTKHVKKLKMLCILVTPPI